MVKAISEGNAIVIATTERNNLSAVCMFTVEKKWAVGTEGLPDNSILIHAESDRLYVNTPFAETISVYSYSGMLLYRGKKEIGEQVFHLSNIHKILLVKGSTGWTKKVYHN